MVGFHAFADVTSTEKTVLDVSIPCKPVSAEFVDLYLAQQTPTVLGEVPAPSCAYRSFQQVT